MSKYSLFTVPEKPKKLDRIGALKGGPFAFSASIVAEHQKIEGGPFGEKVEIFEKKVAQSRKTERGTL